MKQLPVDASCVLRLHVGRLVIDAAALGDLPRDQLVAQLATALAQRLAGSGVQAAKASGLAGHIADVAAPQVQQRLPTASGARNGAV